MKSLHKIVDGLSALAALLVTANLATADPPKRGEKFPDLSSYGLEGKVPSLSGKVVLIDFFASWCGPCQDSFPAMEKLYKQYADKGLVIVAVNLDKKKEDMTQFLKEHPASFVILRDSSYKLVNDVKIPTMPSSFLLDRTGKVYAIHHGFEGSKTVKEYTSEIEMLLNQAAPIKP